ncbi:MAG TPA: adenylate/guanylate cyclase domain-containing protein [Stellaceae bacterium]|nr:adenylate/guanylate cyclase domain-containing protein [Stellaceae bacterium]
MPPERVERKLAAILAADVAGFSRLMGVDEAGTARGLREHRAAVDPIVASHGGRIVKTTGDGVLLEFPSIVAAVECAVAVQKIMAERNAEVPQDRRMLFRIGINLGDVLIEDDDILGDGVNVAARLESIAEPGGICISESSYQQVRDRLALPFEDMGEQQLKNIVRPVRVYRVPLGATPAREKPTLALPDKPSIAVLPFHNMSGDPEQEYFADGVVEEIITALSRFRSLFVIARNSSFTYKGRAVDVKQIGRELGARYVLEGSVRKAANRVRIIGQLIDTLTGVHLWADRFEGALEDVFDLQDKVTASVVGAIAPKLEQAEIERAKRKPTQSLDAYDYYLRAMASHYQITSREANAEALRLFNRAIELDPEFASAYAMAAYCYVMRKVNGWMIDPANETAEAGRLTQRAVELGKDDAVALATGGWAQAYVVRDLDTGVALIDRALALNPNLAAAWLWGGHVKIWLGEPDAAIERLARAMRLSPLGPYVPRMQNATAHAHFYDGRYDEASSWAAMALQDAPDLQPALRTSAASNALAGRLELAQKAVARLRQLNPALRVSNLRDVMAPFRRPEDFARYEEGLRQAGLPE